MKTWSLQTYCNLFRFSQPARREDSVDGTVTWLDNPGFESGQRQRFLFSLKSSDRIWVTTRLLLSDYLDYFPGIKRPESKDDHSLPSSDEVKNEWNCTSALPPHTLPWRGQWQLPFCSWVWIQDIRYRRLGENFILISTKAQICQSLKTSYAVHIQLHIKLRALHIPDGVFMNIFCFSQQTPIIFHAAFIDRSL